MDVDGISIARALEIENASIVEGEVNASGNLVLTNKGGTEFNAGSVVRPPQIDAFIDTVPPLGYIPYVIPEGATLLHIQCIGGGGGGAAGTVAGGDNASGGGGSGGGFNEAWVPVSALVTVDSFRIEVGAGGVGGGFSGAAGGSGNPSSFTMVEAGSQLGLVTAPGGLGGLAVSPVSSGDQPVAAAPNIFAGPGGSGRGDFATPSGPASALRGGGGGGGGINAGSGQPISNGGVGGGAGGGNIGTVGPTGQNVLYQGVLLGGGGGMGGGAHTVAPIARPGSQGGSYGGGGGGGAGVNLQFGDGGNGNSGIVVVIAYF